MHIKPQYYYSKNEPIAQEKAYFAARLADKFM